jgi:hypothetical protein
MTCRNYAAEKIDFFPVVGLVQNPVMIFGHAQIHDRVSE